ncbi:hypothetical protein EV424DRAFT_1353290 [Suillus variegatus]|nr:hypothetical protein EV424DRAFT_1353290 [Suillus variegatus]
MKRAIMIKGNNGGRTHEQPERHESDDSSSESDADKINDTIAPDRNTVSASTLTPGKLLPSSAGLDVEEITDEYFGNNLIVKPKQKWKTKLAAYEMDARDYALRNDLNVWHQKMLVDLGINDPFFGPALIFPDPILTWIIDLSHHSKLSDVSALRDLTDWCYADEYGENVLVLVCNHYLPPAVVPAPQPNIQLTNTLPQAALDPSVLSTNICSNMTLKKPRKATQGTVVGKQLLLCTTRTQPSLLILARQLYEVRSAGNKSEGFGLAGFVGLALVGIDTTGQDIGRTNARENIGSEAANAQERRVCIRFASGLADKRRIEWLNTSSAQARVLHRLCPMHGAGSNSNVDQENMVPSSATSSSVNNQ